MTKPLVDLTRFVPRDLRDWDRALRDFSRWFKTDGSKAIVSSTATLDTRDSTNLGTVLGRIADTGKAVDQRFLPSVSVVNWLSAQSADPLTSSSTSTESTINVASYTVRYGAGTVAYSAGSVTGLTPGQTYYVYAEDADLQGGAVAYTATTDPLDVVAGNSRVRVGVITTAVSASTANITDVTQANPGAVTTGAAHGFNTGDQVTITSVVGMTELNGNTYTITVTAPTTFTIGVNTTGFTAYTSGGTAARVSVPTGGSGGWPWEFEVP